MCYQCPVSRHHPSQVLLGLDVGFERVRAMSEQQSPSLWPASSQEGKECQIAGGSSLLRSPLPWCKIATVTKQEKSSKLAFKKSILTQFRKAPDGQQGLRESRAARAEEHQGRQEQSRWRGCRFDWAALAANGCGLSRRHRQMQEPAT